MYITFFLKFFERHVTVEGWVALPTTKYTVLGGTFSINQFCNTRVVLLYTHTTTSPVFTVYTCSTETREPQQF